MNVLLPIIEIIEGHRIGAYVLPALGLRRQTEETKEGQEIDRKGKILFHITKALLTVSSWLYRYEVAGREFSGSGKRY